MNAVLVNSYNVADQARMAAARNYIAWLARVVKPEIGARVIEIGCGLGNFTRQLLDREAVLGVETDTDCLETWRARYPGLESIAADAADLPIEKLQRFRADSCVCLNVLEHIEDDRAALAGMAAVLPPGGKIVLIVPAFAMLYGPIDRHLGHHRRYGKTALRRVAEQAGLRVSKLRYMNCAGFFGWWINARLLKLEAQSKAQIRFADRFIFPIASRLESVVPPPFGQSLFAVLERP